VRGSRFSSPLFLPVLKLAFEKVYDFLVSLFRSEKGACRAGQENGQEPDHAAQGSGYPLRRSGVFDVTTDGESIVLRPLRQSRADEVRARLAQLGIDEHDVAAAVSWAREER